MHVMRIANRCQVAFTTCMQNNATSWSEPVRRTAHLFVMYLQCALGEKVVLSLLRLQFTAAGVCLLSFPSHDSSGGDASLAGAVQEGGLAIEFDEPIAALFRVGMIVTATFQRLSDGSSSRWELSSPGYCWPSWCCVQGCLSKFAARRSRAHTS